MVQVEREDAARATTVPEDHEEEVGVILTLNDDEQLDDYVQMASPKKSA